MSGDSIALALRRAALRLEEARAELDEIEGTPSEETWLEHRARIGMLLASFNDAATVVDKELGLTSGQQRIIRYLQLHLRQTVSIDRLTGVSGISAVTRRVRELREEGWMIHSPLTNPHLEQGEYVLMAPEPDQGLVRRWAAARQAKALTEVSGSPATPQLRLLAFLKAIHPDAAESDQVEHVVGENAADSAVADLRSAGWLIVVEQAADGVMRTGLQTLDEAL